MNDKIPYERAIAFHGNTSRLTSVFDRAKNGEALTLAFLGGSITQGSVATAPRLCYAYRTYDWFVKTFPKADLTYVNAGIGGTTSHLGTARCESDVLSKNPDLVIVEFSVNDADDDPHFKETYEGLVRRILVAPSRPAVLLVHNVRYDDGGNAQAMHSEIGYHYQLPCISMQSTIYTAIERGDIDKRDITPDDLHPNDAGHELVAGVIIHALEKFLAEGEVTDDSDCASNARGRMTAAAVCDADLPLPLTENAYQNCRRYVSDNSKPVMKGFTADTEAKEAWDHFKNGFRASAKGASITFTVEGECIAVQYRKTIKKPAPVATAIIDGDREHAVVLDGNFDETWGDCLYLETVTEHGRYVSDGAACPGTTHEVTVEITQTTAEDQNDFYLLSIITAGGAVLPQDRFQAHQIYLMKPALKHRIWGGNLLKEEYGYQTDEDCIGEAWAISALPGGNSIVLGGSYYGWELGDLYREHRELFGGREEEDFPLLVKLIDAKTDLSIQVHPNDEYAREKEHVPYGKTECWYIVDCDRDAKLVLGHNAHSREELKTMIEEGRFGELLRLVDVKRGDFLQIDPGTIHAIKGGTLILETQQSSDITYRVYDYDRLENGKPRQLHKQQSIEVTNVPGDKAVVRDTSDLPVNTLNELISCKYYKVFKMETQGRAEFEMHEDYMLGSVLSGTGFLNDTPVKKGDHFLLPYGYGKVRIEGNLLMILSAPGNRA